MTELILEQIVELILSVSTSYNCTLLNRPVSHMLSLPMTMRAYSKSAVFQNQEKKKNVRGCVAQSLK